MTLMQSTISTGNQIIRDGLVLWLDASNYPGSGTTWTDISGRNNNGTLTNGPTYSSNNSGSFVFDGTDDYVVCNDSPSLDLDYVSISCWFKTTKVERVQLLMKNNDITTSIAYGCQTWIDGRLYCNLNTTVGGWLEVSPSTYPLNTWINLASSYDGSNFKSYVNGVLFTTTAKTGTVIKNNMNLYISYIIPLSGSIGSMSVYNRGLSDAEVLQNFNALRGRYGI
jgi:hypothetical protein